MSSRDSFKVTDEGGGIIRVDAESRLVRKPMASAICDEVDKSVAGYNEFKILMNMSAMSKGTPAAGLYVLGSMKKYPLQGHGHVRRERVHAGHGHDGARASPGSPTSRSSRRKRSPATGSSGPSRPRPPRPGHGGPRAGGLRRLALPAGLLAVGAIALRRRRRH